MLGKLFGQKKLKTAIDLGKLATDMHSHLIPGIDDGSPDMSTSIRLVKGMESLGYSKIITTPHISTDIYRNNPEIIYQKLALLQDQLKQEKVNLKIEAAAEYLLDDGFINLVHKNQILTFGDKYVLVELPYFHLPPNLFDITFELQIKGYRIMLAHPERYLYWYNQLDKFQELKNRGIFFQLNIISLTGHYSSEVKKMAEKLIDAQMIDFLGSDMHNDHYLELLKRARYEKYLEKVITSGKILNNTL